jgi:hypothetical protein
MGKKKDSTRPYKTAIVIPDPHVPRHDPQTHNAILAYAADCWWDYWICLGDLMDFNCISSHNKDKLRLVENQRIKADYKVANELLDRYQEACRKKNPDCEFILEEGNHDERIERYIDANPALEGMLEVPLGLRLKERGVEWVPAHRRGAKKQIGNAIFIHGKYHNEHHAKKHALNFGKPVIYGDTHDLQSFSRILDGDDSTIQAQSLGCTCLYAQDYLHGSPTRWQQAFGVFHFWPDGYFQPTVVPIFKHRFVGPTNGKVYDGR